MNIPTSRYPFSVAWAGFSLVLYGAAKTFFGTWMLVVTTMLGPVIGPVSLIALNATDLIVGVYAGIVGFQFLRRRYWAGAVARTAWIGILMYEIGRALGLAVAGFPRFDNIGGASGSVVIVLLLISAGFAARSPSAETFFKRDS